jgi:hypothetical protein
MNRLMIGAGSSRSEGWMTLDGNPKRGGDFIAVIPPLPEGVKAVAWDEIEWIHGIASLYPWDAEVVIAEIYSVLAPGGRLSLEQPDFTHASKTIRWCFGDPDLVDPLHMNRWGYTPETLSELLRKCGFDRIEMLPAQHHVPSRDFRIEAYR